MPLPFSPSQSYFKLLVKNSIGSFVNGSSMHLPGSKWSVDVHSADSDDFED